MPKLLEVFKRKVDRQNFYKKEEVDSKLFLYKYGLKFSYNGERLEALHIPKYAINKQFIYVMDKVGRIFNDVYGYEAKTYEEGENYYLDITLTVVKESC